MLGTERHFLQITALELQRQSTGKARATHYRIIFKIPDTRTTMPATSRKVLFARLNGRTGALDPGTTERWYPFPFQAANNRANPSAIQATFSNSTPFIDMNHQTNSHKIRRRNSLWIPKYPELPG
jgi:hypothetical protein